MTPSIFRHDLFQGKTAIVTGGGSGIGLRTAMELASLGAHVIIAGRNEERLKAACEKISSVGKCSWHVIDIRDEESVNKFFDDIISGYDGFDYLVNNAGGQFPSPAEEFSYKGWKAVIDTNLNGTFLMCQTAFKKYMKKNGGRIVNVVANFWNGFPLVSHTGAARAAVDNLTKSLCSEWGRFGVSINSVAPGVIESSGLDTYEDKYQKFVRAQGKNNQTNRLGTEGEVAAAIVFLLSPVAQYITGETLKVDGGESIYHFFLPPSEHGNLKPELI